MPLGQRLKGRVQISLVDEHGIAEAGIDGGGLYKEFLTTLLRLAFSPSYGLFKETEDHFCYPNPASASIISASSGAGENGEEVARHLDFFVFLGRVLGKALYDGIQLGTRLANFFLRQCLGQANTLNDLQSLDPTLYKNLIFLKEYEGSVEELELTFSVDTQVLGQTKSFDLIPGGAGVAVTNANRMRYIYHMADFKLNKQLARQSRAFLRVGRHNSRLFAFLFLLSFDQVSLA